MSDVYLLGDVVTLSTTITDSAGALADPTSLTLAYSDAAGTVTATKQWPTPADITRDSLGTFHYDISGLAAGHYTYTWTSAGLNAGADSDVFEVLDPAAIPRLVSTADAKAFLRLSGTADDVLLDRMVTWASARIIREMGAVTSAVRTDTVLADCGGFILPRTPVVSLSAITALSSYQPTIALSSAVITDALAGTVDLVGTTAPYGYYAITYRAGYTYVPPGVDGAVLDLIRHWWNQTQAHGSATYGDDGFIPDFTTLPNSVLNKLASIPKIPGIA